LAAGVDVESTTTAVVVDAPDVDEMSEGDVDEDATGPTTATGSAGGGTTGVNSGGMPNANGLLDRAAKKFSGGAENSEKPPSPGWLNSENLCMAAEPRASERL